MKSHAHLFVPPIVGHLLSKIKKGQLKKTAERRLTGASKLHLACGTNILSDWHNIDIFEEEPVIYWNLVNRLPVGDSTVEVIYSEHFIEHIAYQEAKDLLIDCHRVLKPGGTIRLSTPDLSKIIYEYEAKNLTEWQDVGWLPASPCHLLNEAFKEWGHQFLYDRDEIENLLKSSGFSEVSFQEWRKSSNPLLQNLECRPNHSELIIEARK